jgi:hypothetical protein
MPPRSGVEYETELVPVCAKLGALIIKIAVTDIAVKRMPKFMLTSHQRIKARSLPLVYGTLGVIS